MRKQGRRGTRHSIEYGKSLASEVGDCGGLLLNPLKLRTCVWLVHGFHPRDLFPCHCRRCRCHITFIVAAGSAKYRSSWPSYKVDKSRNHKRDEYKRQKGSEKERGQRESDGGIDVRFRRVGTITSPHVLSLGKAEWAVAVNAMIKFFSSYSCLSTTFARVYVFQFEVELG